MFLRSVALAAVVSLAACSSDTATTKKDDPNPAGPPSWWKSTVTIDNQSNYAIHHLFLAPWNESNWGADQFGADVLNPGESGTISGIECNRFDMKIIDQDGDECVLQDVDLCQEDAHWEITDKELISCQNWTAATGSGN